MPLSPSGRGLDHINLKESQCVLNFSMPEYFFRELRKDHSKSLLSVFNDMLRIKSSLRFHRASDSTESLTDCHRERAAKSPVCSNRVRLLKIGRQYYTDYVKPGLMNSHWALECQVFSRGQSGILTLRLSMLPALINFPYMFFTFKILPPPRMALEYHDREKFC
jgi:hypothetical protein